ncbi:MAG: L-rhamnose mutarotase [Oceanospirillaceae bacterium]|nr:L-rhamnose mutarotase [Oceanospirillaceae bacterium]
MKQYALALDLKDDPQLIIEYEQYHAQVWPEVLTAIRHVGILEMKIFRTANRLFMLMETTEDYDPQQAKAYFSGDQKSQQWEQLMNKFQQRIVGAPAEDKWVAMDCCFQLSSQQT